MRYVDFVDDGWLVMDSIFVCDENFSISVLD